MQERSGYENNMPKNMNNRNSGKKHIYDFYISRIYIAWSLQSITSVKWFSTFSLFLERFPFFH